MLNYLDPIDQDIIPVKFKNNNRTKLKNLKFLIKNSINSDYDLRISIIDFSDKTNGRKITTYDIWQDIQLSMIVRVEEGRSSTNHGDIELNPQVKLKLYDDKLKSLFHKLTKQYFEK